jgi:hypothetical protein
MQKLSKFRTEATIAILEILKKLDKEFIPMCIMVAESTQIEHELTKETALEIANVLVTDFLNIQREKWDGFLEYINFKPKLSSEEVNQLIKSLIKGE